MKIQNNLNRRLEHTLLRPDAIETDILGLCREAGEQDMAAVCVNPVWVATCAESLKNSRTHVCTVIGFPLGSGFTANKIREAELCVEQGAQEIDMVMNIGFFKDKHYNYILEEIQACKKAIGDRILKVIIESGLLDDNEKRMAVDICADAGADFVKTSSGYYGGATLHDILLLRREAPDKMRIKASGGIKDMQTALELIEAGADRIGTSSALAIINEWKKTG